MLEIKNVSYNYKGNADKDILKDVNYSFEPGVFYSILGTSGSGKTTLLSLLAGLDSPVSGVIEVDGKDIKEEGYQHHRRSNISLIFQSYNLIEYLTPLENIKLVNKNPDAILQSVGLTEDECNRNVKQLSGGQQQRVAIARALTSNAEIILADEPTGNLDTKTANSIIKLLKDTARQENKCVIVVTHSNYLARQSDVTLVLEKGKLNERYNRNEKKK